VFIFAGGCSTGGADSDGGADDAPGAWPEGEGLGGGGDDALGVDEGEVEGGVLEVAGAVGPHDASKPALSTTTSSRAKSFLVFISTNFLLKNIVNEAIIIIISAF